ncbi:gamma-tubulin complex component 3 homolog [Myzus persicae]|uniref:gamma-tubulin complex component 3 homolog n=1 Tax=Myzus persicae TaxID=13164 RepID=UPI000B936577|nr:gamma-tubulin complex component 3 homolog [Myzus persicae]
MINSNEYFGNTFTNELYNTIYTGILKSHPGETDSIDNIMERLKSPQKEQFISLFIDLKNKNDPLDTDFVLRICHKLLEQQNKSKASFLQSDQIIGRNEFSHQYFGRKQLKDDKSYQNATKSSYGLVEKKDNDHFSLPSNRINFLTDARIQFGRELLLNLTQYGQGMKWVKSDNDTTCITIPNLEFVVKHASELGRLHKIIKDYVNDDKEHSGLVAKALKFSLQEKINSYYTYVNKWLHANFDVLEHSKECLRTCIPIDHDVLIRFQCLAKIVKNAKGKSGCNLISSVIRSSIHEIENKMLNEITKPIQVMILHWMKDGEIEDEHGDFFIIENSSESYWNNRHALSSTNTLEFLNKYQLNDIYQTGKNMNLLLKLLSPKMNAKIEKLRENIKILAANGDGLVIMLTDKCSKISTIISETCDQSSALMMEVLINDYNLFQHFEGFRNYMLLGRGDFYTCVIHKLEPYFGNNEIYNYQLKDIIKNAYALTSAKNDSKELFNNLKCQIDTVGKVNWNSIKFEYKTDEPLNQIFGSCFIHYAKVFQFLWRLKNVDWTTHKMWHELAYFVKKSYHTIELKPVLRNINTLLSSMLSCVNEIQNFVFETINDEWEQFKSEIHRATCIKTVTDAHMSFLESITKCVDDGTVSLDSYVESLNIQVERFLNVFRCFIDTVELPSSEKLKTRKYIKRCEENNLINAFMGNFGAIKKQYETELGDFLIKLKDSMTRGRETLALRIDFNGYYSSNVSGIHWARPCVADLDG